MLCNHKIYGPRKQKKLIFGNKYSTANFYLSTESRGKSPFALSRLLLQILFVYKCTILCFMINDDLCISALAVVREEE